ncbi:DNA-formamidopyrimidine glycosylase [[Mycoplasma] gypis]|uniref:DNA-formamidopyrimidine glycosylase n=1 Tax=[Mycoplasma] gypis TaxID=92404 RepID=A0ABZ2RTZ7_9BACT|nr:DNA-formamidopyrimidine glycosylase [[Mycoplasma] gypis]MBN0919106.1 DNA-formamidopyrimidine glycosylase [[Mycoplasma] gypis]
MPELPEVKVVVKSLKNHILNKEIERIDVYNPKLIKEISFQEFKKTLEDKKILDMSNVAKHIIFFLSDDIVLISHLRMEGKYRFYTQQQEPDKHAHVIFNFKDKTQLQYVDSRAFGTFHVRTKENYLSINPLQKVAPTPDKVDLKQMMQKISKSSVAIKTIILNQEIVSGIGNIYADETLFASKINPVTPAKDISLDQLKTLMNNAYLIMKKSEELGGSTINSYESLNKQEGQFQNFLKVHTRVGKPCSECRVLIKKTKVNGRGTYYCPKCQGEIHD